MKNVGRVISSAVMLFVAALLCAAASQLPQIILPWYPDLTGKALGVIGAVTGVLPFPVWQAIVVLLTVWAIVSLIHDIKKVKIVRWLTGVLWGVCFAALLFVAVWGAGQFLPTKTEQILTVRTPSVARLANAAAWYGQKASALADEVPRNAEGTVDPGDIPSLAAASDEGFKAIAERYDCIPDEAVKVKPLLLGEAFSYTGTTGIFVPFTAEACVNPGTYGAALPHTICHERAHRIGVNQEADANFIAYLACAASSDVRYRYSGEFTAFLHCYNALYEADPQTASAVWQTLSPRVQADLLGANAHYKPYEGKVQDAAQTVNDTYLKTFAQEEGVESYGKVSDALTAWYVEMLAES
ncbi:MAG: DUF3810 domain-containing protein [Oscillospiraceae bacterium]|nr:DUF3810 domain-containing protein [Oscillospiraceae bacterium]